MGRPFKASCQPLHIDRIRTVCRLGDEYQRQAITFLPLKEIRHDGCVFLIYQERRTQHIQSVVLLQILLLNEHGDEMGRRKSRIDFQGFFQIAPVQTDGHFHFLKIHNIIRIPDHAVGILFFIAHSHNLLLQFLNLQPKRIRPAAHTVFPIPGQIRNHIFRIRTGLVPFNH